MDKAFDLQEFLPYALNRAAEAAGQDFQRIYKACYGMLRTEWRVLFHLGHFGPMTAREICDRGDLHKTKVSRAVKALETRRFLTRKELDHDRRHESLSLTKTGTAAYRDLAAHALAYDKDLSAKFSANELTVLRKCLRKLAEG